MARTGDWQLWGSELSPFALKLALCCRHAGLPYRFLPEQGSRLENLRALLRVQAVKRGWLPLTWPERQDGDEWPLVPYLLGPDGENLFDSTAIAEWLDRRLPPDRRLIPEEPLAAFIARLIDDYADEWGLYLVHHQRWVVSAADNDAGQRLAREYRSLIGPLQPLMARWFAARQTRRLPYLFSVARKGFRIEGLPARRQPPSRSGFPATHDLLEDAHARLCTVLDSLLAGRPWLLGERFSLADAAIYGQLAMNLSDPSTARHLRERHPRLEAWLQRLHRPGAAPAGDGREWRLDAALRPLLREISRSHLPLMRQNAAACGTLGARSRQRGSEAAFDAGQALYEGQIDGQPYRSVAKRFQARVWRDCQARLEQLGPAQRRQLAALMPGAAF